jgi:hypothetical protein
MTCRVVCAAALAAMLIVPAGAFAELRKVDLKTLGMD